MIVVASLMALSPCNHALAQPAPGGVCKLVAERTGDVGIGIRQWHMESPASSVSAVKRSGRIIAATID